jgi:hypothetical protein
MTIIRSALFRGSYLAVPGGRLDLRPPKIIVGLSVTLPSEDEALPQTAVILPAVLDTGVNRTLEIDEWHLLRWAGIHKEHLGTVAKDKVRDGRKYDLREANVWLHRTPYEGPTAPRTKSPILLEASTQIRVMATVGKPNPRLPLLGLDALIENKLQLRINGANTRFRIYRSIGTIVSSLFNDS